MDDYFPPNNSSTLSDKCESQEMATSRLNTHLQSYLPITLEEMDTVKLMNRTDTKFLISEDQLDQILSKAGLFYRAVEIGGEKITPYSTIYFDTSDAEMYTMHHNGKLNRCKIRTRSYLNSGISFLEIKLKNNKGRTSKKRIEIDQHQFQTMSFGEKECAFLEARTGYNADGLAPQVQNRFWRITLVDKSMTERVTIDFGLQFITVEDSVTKMIDGLVIVEMKQDGACKSKFREYLNELSVLPGSMSKYCLGMALLHPEVKNNRFKTKLRKINKITQHHDSN